MHMSLADNLRIDNSLPHAANTATGNGTTVQTGRDGFARMAEINVGTWTDGTHTLTFEESADGSAWTEIGSASDATAFDDPESVLDSTTLNAVVIGDNTRANTTLKVGVLSNEDYLRVVRTVSGATTGAVYGANIVTGKLREAGPVII